MLDFNESIMKLLQINHIIFLFNVSVIPGYSITKLLQINIRIFLFNVRLHVVFKLLSQQSTPIRLIQMSESLLSR